MRSRCVLGSRLEAIRVEDAGRHAPALAALDRATVSLVAEPETAAPPPADDDLASRVLSGRALAAAWLAGVGTAPTAADALRRRSSLAPHRSLVSPDGTWVGPNWIRVFRRRDDEAGPLSREREIGSLRQSIAAAGSEAEERQSELGRIRREAAAAEGDREALEAGWADANDRYARRRSELAARAAEAKARRRRREELDGELEELGRTLGDLGTAIGAGEAKARAARESGERLAAEGEGFDESAARREAEVGAGRESADRARQEAHEAALALESTTVQAAALEEARLRSGGPDGGAAGGHGGVAAAPCRDRGSDRRCREDASRTLGEPPGGGGRPRRDARGGRSKGE